jgi:RNA polymerase sigma-70 factor (ECF subfamily)
VYQVMAQAVGGFDWLAAGEGRDALARAQSAEAEFEAFFVDSFQHVVGVAAVVSGDPGVAEDAAQEAYLRAYNRWDAVRRMDRPDRWVARVAINLVLDGRRRARRETELSGEVEQAAHDQVEAIWVRWNLDRLTPMQRATLMMRYVEGFSISDLAAALGKSADTVKTHIRLGRQRLRELLLEGGA